LPYHRILVGTDGSATARIAERTAVMLARAMDADLVIASAYRDDAQRVDAILAESARAAEADWPRVDRRSARGDPADVLVSLAQDEQADLVVVGNRGMTGKARFLLGSVPDKVSHSAPCDLLIVQTTSRRRADASPSRYGKALIATDASQTSLQAVRRGFRLAEQIGTQPVLFYGGHPKTADIVFAEVARAFLPAGMLATASRAGDPADAICEAAEREEFDLIVMGNKGMLGGGLHLGSVPNQVSHRAPTDLLIVKTTAGSLEDLLPGDGAVLEVGGESRAAWRDDEGAVHLLSPRCTHMGCTVGWNSDARTWDCPCHGSRYAASGEVINGPARKSLALTAEDAG
jgi:nucleotide-binding universal stress UspA family protein/nitrite reductase/ring-hydroxylating ferredoxin subunit